jgi:hypothetical protein
MDNKPKRRSLNGEIFCRHARVMERVAIGRAILELQFRHGEQQHPCTMSPFLIRVDQAAEQPIVLDLVVFRGNQKPPGLPVIR